MLEKAESIYKVTADKTHFSIDIKILIILVYPFIFQYYPPVYNIESDTTSFLIKFTSQFTVSVAVPPTLFHNVLIHVPLKLKQY